MEMIWNGYGEKKSPGKKSPKIINTSSHTHTHIKIKINIIIYLYIYLIKRYFPPYLHLIIMMLNRRHS